MEWAIEVNVGSWSGKSAREMAQEADCESLYKFCLRTIQRRSSQHVAARWEVQCRAL